jgi:hypothetical protein
MRISCVVARPGPGQLLYVTQRTADFNDRAAAHRQRLCSVFNDYHHRIAGYNRCRPAVRKRNRPCGFSHWRRDGCRFGIGAAILVGVRRILETQAGQTILGFFVFCGLLAVLAGVFYVIGYR